MEWADFSPWPDRSPSGETLPREGKAPVLTDVEGKRVLKVAGADLRHGVRNVARRYVSVGLGLRVREIRRLAIGDVEDG